MARRSIVVVGGSVAGAAAAMRARELDGDARIVLVERAEDADRLTPGLPYWLSREAVSLQAVRGRPAESFWDVHRIEVRAVSDVSGLDAAARRVRVGDETLEYTSLVYAADARPAAPGVLGPAQKAALRAASDLRIATDPLSQPGRTVLVIGEGPEAVEAADALARGGHRVTLAAEAPRLLPEFSATVARRAAQALAAAGIEVLTPATGLDFQRAADLVLLAGMVRPDADLLRQAGAETNTDGSIWIDEMAATSLPHVFACGSSVAVPHAVSNWPVWPLPPSAVEKTAVVAGTSAVGVPARLGPVVGTMVVRAGDLVLARTGLTREEADAYAGPDVGVATVHGSSAERFLSASQTLSLEMLYHRADGRILAAEAWGGAGVDKRIDVLAAALLGGLTVEQLSLVDLAYAAPFGTVRDVANVAGRVAEAARAGLARPWAPDELAKARGRVAIVDVEPERGRVGDIHDSIVVPLPELRDRLAALPRDRPLVFVSLTGRTAYLAARIAIQAGMRDAGFLSGGMLSWTAAGLPVKQASESR
jgi:NADPH-dependent 2,4-dienoyl-CoA reductase/sulfur reductase-like enzyme/rhodanese-related sulfurtransferase